MAKLINILAASVGGGLLLGAGIRLGEALIARPTQPIEGSEMDGKLAARIGGIEERLLQLESHGHAPAAGDFSIPRAMAENQATEVQEKVEALNEMSLRLRDDLQNWLEDNVGQRMAGVESKLRAESEQSRKEMLDALVEGVQTRVMHRIAKLENELASQSAAMAELRECSIRTEQSMQKLLGGLDRLIVAQQQTAVPHMSTPSSSDTEHLRAAESQTPMAEPQSSPHLLPKSKRWAIFG